MRTILNAMSENIGAALRLWRKKVGLTQEEVAARLDISYKRYNNWELGKVMPPLEYRLKLAEIGVTGLPGTAILANKLAEFSASPDLLSVLIDTVSDCELNQEMRQKAKRELCRILNLKDNLRK